MPVPAIDFMAANSSLMVANRLNDRRIIELEQAIARLGTIVRQYTSNSSPEHDHDGYFAPEDHDHEYDGWFEDKVSWFAQEAAEEAMENKLVGALGEVDWSDVFDVEEAVSDFLSSSSGTQHIKEAVAEALEDAEIESSLRLAA